MSRTLADVVHVLTRPHIQSNGDRVAYVEPLLDTLYALIPPSMGQKDSDGSSGSDGGSRPPISIDAFDLWQQISGKIDREWPYAGHPSTVRVPTTRKVQAWHNAAAQPHEALYLYELCIKWERQILEALEPVKKMPLSGACPECDHTHVETLDEDGDAKFNPALLAFPGADPVYAICQVCEHRWDHEDLHELAARLV